MIWDLLVMAAPWVPVAAALLLLILIVAQRGGDYSGAPANEDKDESDPDRSEVH